MEFQLEAVSLHKRFKSVVAVDDVSFGVKQGTCFGLLGPNGAGKTTTLEMLEGIMEPTSGQILYKGQPITKEVYHRLGIQFQNTALQDYLTAKETLKMFQSFYSHSMPYDELVTLCQLGDFLNQDHRKLSGGQKQRLLLALALINDPELIFLDEPTTGLDPHSRRLFWDLVNTIKANGKTVLLTTHYMDEAEYLCDEIAIMNKGNIIAQNMPTHLLDEHFSGALISLPESQTNNAHLNGEDVHYSEGRCFIQSENVEKTLTNLMASNISLEGLQVKSANLDDLFLKLTGHALIEEESQNV